jgi:dCMP deaminase
MLTRVCLGITGDFFSGKSTLAKQLEEHFNYKIIAIPEEETETKIIKEEYESQLKNMTLSPVLDTPINKSNSVKSLIKENKNNFIVIYPFTKIEHYKELENKTIFKLIRIISPLKLRYNNYISKNPKSNFEEFIEKDSIYSNTKGYIELQNKAHITIMNDSSIQDLSDKIKEAFGKTLFVEHFRPDWIDYFMGLAHLLANRSNCVKQKVGAVLVKSNYRILSTGYNGTPDKIQNCFEGGCIRCNGDSQQGEDLDRCFCIHAEENCVR